MRIGMVAWSFYPRIGGSVTAVIQLAESLVRRGISVDIVAPLLKRDMGKIPALDIDERISVHWVISSSARSYSDFYSRTIFLFKMVLKIRKISKFVDIFHAHDFNIGVFSAIIGAGKRPVVGVFGADPLFEAFNYKRIKCLGYDAFLKSGIVKLVQKAVKIFFALVSKDRFVVVSLSKVMDQEVKRYCSCPTANIPPGVNLNLYAADGFARSRAKKVILVVSRFVCWKGIDAAVDIFRRVKELINNVEMVCAGEGPLARHYLDKYGNLRGVKFVVGLDHRKIAEYYMDSDIFLVTSAYETFGMAVTEAMAAGLPIVASDLKVFRDRLINNVNCYLVREGEVNIFSERILELLNNPGIGKRFAASSLKIAEDYGMDKIADAHVDFYQELLRSGGAGKTAYTHK